MATDSPPWGAILLILLGLWLLLQTLLGDLPGRLLSHATGATS